MSEPGDELRAPQFLEHVEDLVGLRFFSDPTQEAIARQQPAALEVAHPGSAYGRVPIYIAGLRLLNAVRADYGAPHGVAPELTVTQRTEMRHAYARAIGSIRGELMALDPGLETPPVRELRKALAGYRETHPPETFTIPERRNADILPAQLIPASDVNSLVAMSSGSVLQAVRHHGLTPPKLKLPGAAPPQVCVDWEFVRRLAARHGLREDIADEIDLDKLPLGPGDTDPERAAYAREVQARIMDPIKLRNVPELQEQLPPDTPLEVARPYHISRVALRNLLGGGYHFIDEYVKDHRIPLENLRRPPGQGVGNAKYMTLEEAAHIWEAYVAVPKATEDDIALVDATKEAGVIKSSFLLSELTSEEQAVVRDMRALHPVGRVLPHMPKVMAEAAIKRIKPRALAPHEIPVAVLDKRYQVGMSAIHKRTYSMEIASEQVRLIDKKKKVSCITWQDMRELDARLKRQQNSINIDFDRLPTGPDDLDPERIAYARYIQSLYAEKPEHVDQTPIAEWIEKRRAEIARAAAQRVVVFMTQQERVPSSFEWLFNQVHRGLPLSFGALEAYSGASQQAISDAIAAAYALRPFPTENRYYQTEDGVTILDQLVGTPPVELARRTGSDPQAVVHAMAERGRCPNQYGCYPFEDTLQLLPDLPLARRFYNTLDDLLDTYGGGMSRAKARAFIGRHGGRIELMRNEDGVANEYVFGIAAGLLRHLDTAAYDPNTPRKGYLTREQLAQQLRLPLHIIDKRLTAARNEFSQQRIIEKHGSKVIPFIWCENTAGEVVPHYNPVLYNRIREM